MSENAFDTNTTLLYKFAHQFGIPAVFVVVRRAENGDLLYDNTFEDVENAIDQGEALRNIYTRYRKLNPKITLDLIIYLFIMYAYKQKDSGNKGVTDEAILKGAIDLDTINRIGATRFDSVARIKSHVEVMEKRIESYMSEDRSRLAIILEVQNMLVQNPNEVIISEFHSAGNIYNISPVLRAENRPLNPEEAIDIFDNSQATIFVPFIQYNDMEGKSYYRIIKGDLSYEKLGITRGVATHRERNTFYLTIWLGNNSLKPSNVTDLFDATILATAHKTSFYHVIYSIDSGILNITVPERERSTHVTELAEIVARIETGLPQMDVSYVNSTRRKGGFDVYDVDIDEATFLHWILHESFAPFLYVEERLRPFCFKARLDVHYRDMFSSAGEQVRVTNANGTIDVLAAKSIPFTVHLMTLGSSATLKYIDLDGKVKSKVFPEGSKRARFTINGGATSDEITQAINHIRVFFTIYAKTKDELIENVYYDFDPTLLRRLTDRYRESRDVWASYDDEDEETDKDLGFVNPLEPEEGDGGLEVKTIGYRHIEELKAQIPDLFVNGYAQACQNYAQPTIIPPDQIENWKKENNDQVMFFPKGTKKWAFGCTNPNYPNIGVKRNRYLSNKSEYSHVPCCFIEPQMIPDTNTQYNEYMHGRVLPEKIIKLGTKHKTEKILDPGTIGLIPRILEKFLSLERDAEELQGYGTGWEFVHYGVPDTPNSLLHCISEAIDDPNYDGTEEYVMRIRSEIAQETHPDLLRQEMYDYDPDTIIALLADPNRYLDPSLFYRALEEYYSINIYVFDTYRDAYKKDLSGIVVPRNRIFHVRPRKLNRPTVLILSHYGPAAQKRDHPHCELLVDFNESHKAIIKLFGMRMTQNVYDGLTSYTNNISWLPHLNTPVPISQPPPKLYPHDNIYGKLDYVEALLGEGELVSQYIDSIGKARAFTIRYPGPFDITFVTLPSRPENVPASHILSRAKPENVLSILTKNTPFSRSLNSQGQTDGVWYQLFDIYEGIYVPLEPTNNLPATYANLPIGSGNPIKNIASENNTLRYMKMNRTLHILYDILEWLFELMRREMPNVYVMSPMHQNEIGVDVSDTVMITNALFQKAIREDNYTGDSALYYDFSTLERRLPSVNSVNEALRYLSKLPRFESGKVTMYNRKFTIKMYKYLKAYEKRTFGEQPYIKSYIENYFTASSDFKQVKWNIVIMGSDIYDKWHEDRRLRDRHIFEVQEKVNMSIALPTYPQLYMDENKRIYIIQNTSGADIRNALNVGKIWVEKGINPGYLTPKLPRTQIPPHFIYVVAVSERLVPVTNNTGKSETYANVISYTENRYGSLLPLL